MAGSKSEALAPRRLGALQPGLNVLDIVAEDNCFGGGLGRLDLKLIVEGPGQPSPPTITEIAPQSGPTTGGTQVTITGANFGDGATVTVGGTPAVVLDVQPNTIAALTPPHTADSVDVVVTNPDGQSSAPFSEFAYRAPPVPRFAMSFESQSANENQALSVSVPRIAIATIAFSAMPDDLIFSWNWNISGATVSTLSEFSFPLGAGEHRVELIVTDSDGIRGSARALVLVNQSATTIRLIDVDDGDTLVLDAAPFPCTTPQLRVVGVDTPELRGSLKDREKWSVSSDAVVSDMAFRAKDSTIDWLSGAAGGMRPPWTNPVEVSVVYPDGPVCDDLGRLLAYVFPKGTPMRFETSLTRFLVSSGTGLTFPEQW